MQSEDFIDLGLDQGSEYDGMHDSNSEPSELDCQPNTSGFKEDISNGENLGRINGSVEREDGRRLQTDPDNDLTQQTILQENVELAATVTFEEKLNVIGPGHDGDSGVGTTLSVNIVNNHVMDESSVLGVKRARMTCVDQQPSVRVVYNCLTRESKKKLNELLQQWSEWHSQHETLCNDSIKEALEYGEETYFPALHVGTEKSSTVSFWMDNQARKEEIKCTPLDSDSVPLYDRGYVLGSTSLDGSANSERIESLEASRCFNCGSYSHSLKECPKPRDNASISNARKLHNSKRKPTAGSRVQTRYYQNTPGKFDDLRAGVLGAETRECLGIGEFDPPPWLNRMREMGYPPGYLDVEVDEDQPSGITIYADEETKAEVEDGELPEKGELELPEKKMTVEFPGINAPILDNADHRLWASSPVFVSSPIPFKNRSHHRPDRSSESQRGHHYDQKRSRDYRDDGPPGSDYGLNSSMPSYSPRYSSYDHNPIPRSPSLGRSLSDRGWWSPLAHEGSAGQSPHSPSYFSGLSRHSPQHHSPTASLEHWAHESQYSASPDTSSQRRDRQDYRHHHRR